MAVHWLPCLMYTQQRILLFNSILAYGGSTKATDHVTDYAIKLHRYDERAVKHTMKSNCIFDFCAGSSIAAGCVPAVI